MKKPKYLILDVNRTDGWFFKRDELIGLLIEDFRDILTYLNGWSEIAGAQIKGNGEMYFKEVEVMPIYPHTQFYRRNDGKIGRLIGVKYGEDGSVRYTLVHRSGYEFTSLAPSCELIDHVEFAKQFAVRPLILTINREDIEIVADEARIRIGCRTLYNTPTARDQMSKIIDEIKKHWNINDKF